MVSSAQPSPITIREIEELAIGVVAKNLNPAMLTVDFLKFSGIVPNEWELNAQPVLSPNYSQVNFQNGISVVAQPRSITFVEVIGDPTNHNIRLPSIVSAYVDKLSLAEYQTLNLAPKSIIPLPGNEDVARKYITNTLLSPGPWQDFGQGLVQAGINLTYQLDNCQLNIGINEAKLQLPDRLPIPALLFAGSFNYELEENTSVSVVEQLKANLHNLTPNLQIFRQLVKERFLAQKASVIPTLMPPTGPKEGL
ncbi:MAG: hypothetical protein N5P05_003085 [Chroococcopsis gigantea SAG 12.99]|jgi:hypothetical protein|nr:hypothetical protein [Chlorogloea purpurea SAG 13.99]MDV3001479.1 hypothetical protein [Chroococcopsis gigantea SAG 12.99]